MGYSFTFSYTLGSMKCDSWASFLVPTFASLYFGHEPKAKVATICSFDNGVLCCLLTKQCSHNEIFEMLDIKPNIIFLKIIFCNASWFTIDFRLSTQLEPRSFVCTLPVGVYFRRSIPKCVL